MKQKSLKRHQVPQALAAAVQQHRMGYLGEARGLYLQILRLEPRHADALHLLGLVEEALGNSSRALELLEKAVKHSPRFASYRNSLGVAYRKAGRLDAARQEYQTALQLAPDHADALNNLANLLRIMACPEQALPYAQKAVVLQPKNALFHNNLAGVLVDLGAISAAICSYETAVSLQPDYADAYCNVRGLYHLLGNHDMALEADRKLLSLAPKDFAVLSDYLLSLNYLLNYSQPELAREHRVMGARFLAAPLSQPPNACDAGVPGRRVRIGYLSPDFHRHPVGYLINAVLANYDRERFEVHCYYSRNAADDFTDRFREQTDGWFDCHQSSDLEVAQQIRDDGIDILVDLAGHTAFNRLPVFALKPAPIQVSWLGYFNTTGLATMDYLITDRHSLSDEEAAQFVERVVHLPNCRFCYTPPAVAPTPSWESRKSEGTCFGSFNNTGKLSPDTVKTWAGLLLKLPDSRLILKWKTLETEELRKLVRDQFGACGIAADRLDLRGFSPHPEMLAQYGDVDLALDPFPFSGGITSLEALWMGVPVITLNGDRPAGRQTAAFLSVLGLEELVAADHAEYIEIAASLARDRGRRQELSTTLRMRMANSPLCDARAFTRDLEKLYLEMWHSRG
jgi:protein O-GlcNAc transferase